MALQGSSGPLSFEGSSSMMMLHWRKRATRTSHEMKESRFQNEISSARYTRASSTTPLSIQKMVPINAKRGAQTDTPEHPSSLCIKYRNNKIWRAKKIMRKHHLGDQPCCHLQCSYISQHGTGSLKRPQCRT